MLNPLEQESRAAWERNIDTHRLIWPDAEVVRFLGHSFARGERQGRRALDIGCGGGRHLACMAREGFEVYGLDYNVNALDQARRAVVREGQPGRVLLGDIAALPIADARLDVVVAWGVLFNTTADRSVTMLRQIRRVLKPDGRLLANWRTSHDDLRHRGKKIEGRTYLLSEEAGAFGLEGTLYSFYPRRDVEKIYERGGFRVDNIERRDLWINNLAVHCSWWIVWASKPSDRVDS